MGPSIEESLEKSLTQILQHPVQIQAASRTDAGVHAIGQVAQFVTDKEITNIFQNFVSASMPFYQKIFEY